MVLDASALVAIALEESGYRALTEKAGRAARVVIGAPTAVEAAMVVSSRAGRDARPMIASLLRSMDAEIIEFNQNHYEAAVTAFLRFGKGRHPAALNFGDCLCYALADLSGFPILCTGDDFARTDIQCA